MYEDLWIKNSKTGEERNAYKPNFQQYYLIDGLGKVTIKNFKEMINNGEWIIVDDITESDLL